MTNKTLSELLILFLLLLTNSRFIYIKRVRRDALSAVPTVALLLSILNIIAWGVSLPEMLILLLSFLTFIWNFRALLRLASKLVIDHYGFWFIFVSAINLILCIAGLVFIIYFIPVSASLRKFNAQVTRQRYSGSFAEGFYVSRNPFEKPTATFYTFSQKEEKKEPVLDQNGLEPMINTAQILDQNKLQQENREPEKIILFVPPKTADVETYMPFLIKLAHDGYTVYTGEFYAETQWFNQKYKNLKAFRKLSFIQMKMEDQQNGTDLYQQYTRQNSLYYRKEFRALYNYANPSENDMVFLAGDEDTARAMEIYYTHNSSLFTGWFDLATSSSYPTPGFGPVEQTNPFLASRLGQKRDATLYTSSHIANCLEQSILNWTKGQE